MEQTKVCFKCGRELPLSKFYKHPKMADGHLNKCKDCTKNDVHNKYMDNIENQEFVEKERARNREKYHRLGYKDVYKHAHSGTKNVARNVRKQLNVPKTCEIHHWNYNFLYDFFILDKRMHSRIHKKITFDEESKCFLFNGILLDTKQKHKQAIRTILNLSPEQPIEQFIKE